MQCPKSIFYTFSLYTLNNKCIVQKISIVMCRIGESEGGLGGREDQATQTDDDEADVEPPRRIHRIQRPTHFQSGGATSR